MSTQDTMVKYIELSSRTYGLIIDTFASATQSRINYWKAVWEIGSRPYASTATGSAARESFDRIGELTKLTVDELNSRGQRTVNFSARLLTQVGQLQDAANETYRNALKPSGADADKPINGFRSGTTPATPASVSN